MPYLKQQVHPCLNKSSHASPGIYTTKEKFDKQKALTGFVSVGDPHIDPAKRFKADARFKGKQFITRPPIDNCNGAGYLQKDFARTPHVHGVYTDKDGYIKTQPLDKRKLGFGTHDAARRDEFMNFIRTEQYRQQLRTEKKIMDEQERTTGSDGRDLLAKALADDSQRGFPEGLRECRHLYDIGRGLHTEFDPKASRERFYQTGSPTRGNVLRRTGGQWLSSQEAGAGVDSIEVVSPKHGHAHATNTFFNKGHLSVGQ